MKKEINVHEAKMHLSHLLRRVAAGEDAPLPPAL
jgi:antitoxin (DNA-binding transcriptional repressor) of toxin-antitoxin stability system